MIIEINEIYDININNVINLNDNIKKKRYFFVSIFTLLSRSGYT